MRPRDRCLAALAVSAALATGAGQGDVRDEGVEEVRRCLERNAPKASIRQDVEFTATDRIGGESVSKAKLAAMEFEADGLRRVRVKFIKPNDIRGSKMLMIEQTGRAPETFLYTPELRRVKRVLPGQAGASLFGTDFSYEDFVRWQGLNHPGESRRLEDAEVADRPVYVVETIPAEDSESSYTRIVSRVDRETCVVLETESYEKLFGLRKVFTADPDSVIKEAGIQVATEAVMRDLRDGTHTRVVIEDLELDRGLREQDFSLKWLETRRD